MYIIGPCAKAKDTPPRTRSRALDEVVAARAVVGDGAGVLAVLVEDDPVCARRAAGVGLEAAQDRELLVRARDGEVEPLPIVEGVRVVVAADRLAGLEQAAGLFSRGERQRQVGESKGVGWKPSTSITALGAGLAPVAAGEYQTPKDEGIPGVGGRKLTCNQC